MGEVVKLARQLERQLGRRRALQRKVDLLDAEVRSTRKLLSDLTRPFDVGTVDRECPACRRLLSAHSHAEVVECGVVLESRQ